MLLMSFCGLGDEIRSTVLIGVATQNIGYAKYLLQGRLKYLSITKVEFHRLMRLSLSQFSIPELFPRASSKESDSFKAHIDYSKVPSQSIISHSVFVAVFGFAGNTEEVSVRGCNAQGHAICFECIDSFSVA